MSDKKNSGSYSATWIGEKHNTNIKVNLPFIVFDEDGTTVSYCPALDLCGYGNNEAEAWDSFNLSLNEFLHYTHNKGTFTSELNKLGWKIKNKTKPMYPPELSQLLSTNENFNRIFNTYPFRKYDSTVEMSFV